jgi:hypothetical protein
MEKYSAEESQVLLLQERISEAQRFAVIVNLKI